MSVVVAYVREKTKRRKTEKIIDRRGSIMKRSDTVERWNLIEIKW